MENLLIPVAHKWLTFKVLKQSNCLLFTMKNATILRVDMLTDSHSDNDIVNILHYEQATLLILAETMMF